jgi:hypothetical protein
MLRATYLSNNELERAEAFGLGYHEVYQHPREVLELVAGQRLVIDLNHVLFDDKDEAVKLARRAAGRGVWVGIHTYNPDDPVLVAVRGKRRIVIRTTHRRVHAALRKRGR